MTSLREELQAPRRQPAASELAELCAYLDRQSRVHLAAWVAHAHGPDQYDDHLLLGIADADWHGEHAGALEMGIGGEIPHLEAWLDLFAMSDAEVVRDLGEVLWEREVVPGGRLDPLDFRITWEPLDVTQPAADAFAGLVRGIPGVRRIEGGRERLWKNGDEVRTTSRMFVGFDERRPHDFQQIESAIRASGVATTNFGISADLPNDPRVRTAVLYER